jgi:hypothetical protein
MEVEQRTLMGCWEETVADDAANGYPFAQRVGGWVAFFVAVHLGTQYGEGLMLLVVVCMRAGFLQRSVVQI